MNPDEQNNNGDGEYKPLGSAGDASSAGYAYESADVVNNSSYLGEIAVGAPPTPSVWPKRLAIVGGALALFAGLVFVLMNAASDPRPGVANDTQLAYARAETLITLSTSFRRDFNSGELRAAATELEMILGSFQRNLTVIMDAHGVGRPRAPAAEEAFLEGLDQELRDARILMTLERVWVTEITHELELLRARLLQLEHKLAIIDHRQFVERANQEIEEIRTRILRIPIN